MGVAVQQQCADLVAVHAGPREDTLAARVGLERVVEMAAALVVAADEAEGTGGAERDTGRGQEDVLDAGHRTRDGQAHLRKGERERGEKEEKMVAAVLSFKQKHGSMSCLRERCSTSA